jgi:hypothetical protein
MEMKSETLIAILRIKLELRRAIEVAEIEREWRLMASLSKVLEDVAQAETQTRAYRIDTMQEFVDSIR